MTERVLTPNASEPELRFDLAALGGFGTTITAIVFANAVAGTIIDVPVSHINSQPLKSQPGTVNTLTCYCRHSCQSSPFAGIGILALVLLAVVMYGRSKFTLSIAYYVFPGLILIREYMRPLV